MRLSPNYPAVPLHEQSRAATTARAALDCRVGFASSQ